LARKLVIYHGDCTDGFTAAWVCLRYTDYRDAEILGASFGHPPPDVTGKDVLIVDFSYQRDVLLQMASQADSLRVIDHHKTAEEDLEGLDFCVFDMERSGCGLAWDILAAPLTMEPRPWLVNAVEDKDLWRFRLPDTKHILAYLGAQPLTLKRWDAIFARGPEAAAAAGVAIQDYIDNFGTQLRHQARIERIAGYDVPTVNAPHMNMSEHLEKLFSTYTDAPFVAGYFRRHDGKWQFSLRSQDTRVDVSKVAEGFGGGGHRNASGFQADALPWEQRR
jgi:uncharacterized protein